MENTKNILLTLSKLQSSLKEIESAKNQVQSIIDIYEPASKNLSKYTEQLSKFHVEIDDIQLSLNSQINEFEQKVGGAIEVIRTECKSIVDDSNISVSNIVSNADILLKRAGEQFEIGCDKNNELFSNSTATLIEQSQEKIDNGVSKIGEAILSLERLVSNMSKVKLEIAVALEPITALANKIEMLESGIDKNYTQHSKGLMHIASKLDEIHSTQDAFQTNLNESLNKIQEQLDRSDKKSKTHIYISILSFSILLIMFVLFVIK